MGGRSSQVTVRIYIDIASYVMSLPDNPETESYAG